MRILAIRNETLVWKELKHQIEKLGHELSLTTTCRLGMKQLETDKAIDIIIIDFDSTKTCGIKILKSIGSSRSLKQIPIIIAGTVFTRENVIDFDKYNVFDIIMLPTSADNLLAKFTKAEQKGRKKILVVDDEPIICDILKNFLELERFIPIIANSGEEALEIIKQVKLNAIITDYKMPGISGLELLEEVKLNYPHLPVIMITGNSSSFQPKHVIEAGADGYFSKPFKNTELMYTLHQTLKLYENKSLNQRATI